jgi:hypothetical protein
MSALASRVSSPRFQRRLFWAGGAVLAAGIVALIVMKVWTGPTPEPPPAVPVAKAQVASQEKTVPLDPAAQRVGERFIETAVERKNLDESWTLAAPALRGGFTLERWKTGDIPVVPYPADTSNGARLKIEYSYRDRALLLILLEPTAGNKIKPQLFHLGLHAFGKGKSRHWLVDYWAPFSAPKIPLS